MKRSRRCNTLVELAASCSTKKYCVGPSDNDQILPVIDDVFDVQPYSLSYSRECLSESPFTLEFEEWREPTTFPDSPPLEELLLPERMNSPRDVSRILNEEYSSISLETQTNHQRPKRDVFSISAENPCKSPMVRRYSTQFSQASPRKSRHSTFDFDHSESRVPLPNHPSSCPSPLILGFTSMKLHEKNGKSTAFRSSQTNCSRRSISTRTCTE